ncbi:MAG TPA: hypothetical protein VLO11_09550 [Luteolibacter sp.]|nr:hypothetical protein [Luteolibacter sp.]
MLLVSILTAIWIISHEPHPGSSDAALRSAIKAESRVTAEAPMFRARPHIGSRASGATIGGSTTIHETPAAAKSAAMEKMNDAATTYDPAQLAVIRPYLASADPELRSAAVDAMIVLGDASAGAMLREAAARLQSEEEAQSMLEAADYVELPPANLKELTKRNRDGPQTEAPARRKKK